VTAENRLGSDDLALALALRGTRRFPTQAELLLIVERITLQRDDVDTAMETYDGLIEAAVGPHGRRALLYRAGRWLERTDRLGGALARYRRAFELGPSGGVAFKALERVASELGDHDALCDCYETLARHMDDDTARVELLRKAAGLCQTRTGRHERALSLLLDANAATEGHTLDAEVQDAARTLAQQDPEAGRAGWDRVQQALQTRVELLWDGPDKAATLLRLAEIFGGELDDHARAVDCLEQAATLAAREELDPDLRTDIAVARAEELLRIGKRAQARRAVTEALQQTPDHPGALRMEERLADGSSDAAPSERPPAPAAGTRPTGTRATLELARQLLGERTGTVRARELLRDLCIREPGNVEALHTLYEATATSGSGAEHWVAATLMSVFDAQVEAPPAPAFHAALWRDHDLLGAVGEPFGPEVARYLERLWECARAVPRFRGSLRDHGVTERDRISRQTVGPVAEAYGQAARALRIQDVPVFLSLQPDPLVRVLPTHPPSLVAARLGSASGEELLHEVTRGLWLAQPRFAVAGALSAEDARDLLDAADAAFGDGSIASLGDTARNVAAALYQAIPAIEQRELGEIITARREELRPDSLRARTLRSAARAALLVSGALRSAIDLVGRRDPQLEGLDLSQSADFKTGCERSAELAEIVRCALEEPFLGALDRALHTRPR
jgi:tetratricopeptide (TPR) repeat protein